MPFIKLSDNPKDVFAAVVLMAVATIVLITKACL